MNCHTVILNAHVNSTQGSTLHITLSPSMYWHPEVRDYIILKFSEANKKANLIMSAFNFINCYWRDEEYAIEVSDATLY